MPQERWLSILSGEVRNEIYAYLISSGDLSMMRTNSWIGQEMQGLVLEQVPYRIFINYPPDEKRYPPRLPDGKTAEGFQKLEVYWRLPYYLTEWNGFREDEESISALCVDAPTPRKHCLVLLERSRQSATWIQSRDMMALRRLAVFEEVVLQVVLRGDLNTQERGLEEEDSTWLNAHQDRWAGLLLETIGKGVEAALGVAEHGRNGEGQLLTFHPGRGIPGGRCDAMDGESECYVFHGGLEDDGVDVLDKGEVALSWIEAIAEANEYMDIPVDADSEGVR